MPSMVGMPEPYRPSIRDRVIAFALGIGFVIVAVAAFDAAREAFDEAIRL